MIQCRSRIFQFKFKPIEDLNKIPFREQHNYKINLFVMLENDQHNEQSLWCEKCPQTKIDVLNNKKIIKQTLLELHFYLKQKLKYIDEFSMIIKIQFQILEQSIKDTEKRINLWKDQLIKVRVDQCTYSLIQENSNLDKEENQWAQEKQLISQNQINLIDQLHSIKLKLIVDEIQLQIQNIVKSHEQLYTNIQIPLSNQLIQVRINVTLKRKSIIKRRILQKTLQRISLRDKIKQNMLCYRINRNDSIMAAGYNQCIKIWKIENEKFIDSQIILLGKLEVDFAICIAFSKRTNLFVYEVMIVVQEYGLRL
ncbi:unnamed protein product [Paramecium primaurelia]|uniref:Uncharacterized protein n=1 Tax=Paramecium primaurelia TaxID=5886 RepID=A0A8S1QM57_PARPR|nr:unnamed protein product [Paramecium primaurelia]